MMCALSAWTSMKKAINSVFCLVLMVCIKYSVIINDTSEERKKADSFYRGIHRDILFNCLSMESKRLGGPAHRIVTKTVHKTLIRGVGGPEVV